jgi:large subunit ribosomal protein L13
MEEKVTKKPVTKKRAAPAKEAVTKVEHFADMNKAFFLRKEDNAHPKWRVIDAQGRVLGRLATEISDILRGKDRAIFTPHTDSGDYVVVINAKQVVLTGKKLKQKQYARYTGWIGGLKHTSAEQMLAHYPDRLVTLAVKGMLPKNILSRYLLRKLRVYPGVEHPHGAHIKQ